MSTLIRIILNLCDLPRLRRSIAEFDPDFYASYYSDVDALANRNQLLRHYIWYSLAEERFCSANEAIAFFSERYAACPEDFSVEGYKAANSDVRSLYAHDWQYILHYMQFGRQEGRSYIPERLAHLYNLNDQFRYHFTYELTKPDGVIPSRRPLNEVDYSLEVPFGPNGRQLACTGSIAAVVHCFYPDVLPLILDKLRNIPLGVDLFLSTDSETKFAETQKHCANWTKGAVEVRLLPNKGRDIAPKFIGFRDIYERYDLFVHLHTKESPHGGEGLAKWRDYLLDNLLGSPEIAASNLSLFDDPRLGFVYPQHFFELRGVLNWGYDYDLARKLLRKMGIEINKNLTLEFPSGSMFWGRSSAIRPLLDADLTYDDFQPERGQIDGTLAHAIERSLLYIAESRGYEWLKVCRKDLYPLPETVLQVDKREDVAKHRLKVFQPCLSNVDASLKPSALGIAETRPLLSYPSRNDRPRLNLLVPTVNPRQSFGGLASARRFFADLASTLGDDYDRRIIATDAIIEKEGYAALPDSTPTAFAPSLDQEPWSLVDANARESGRLDLRAGDIFIATAWWTAGFAIDLAKDQKRYFGVDHPFIYLIQDDEPYFYGWGSKFSRAEATYHHPERTIAIINSEELFSIMREKYNFIHSFCIPYRINDEISSLLAPKARERRILVYGRPSATRNAYETICDALVRWQQCDPVRASRWTIVFLGENFDQAYLSPLQNAVIDGKVTIEKYADYLNTSTIGISMMVSPHPSYPPLEMAEAGLITITNDYCGKTMQRRQPNIVALPYLEPDLLAIAIEKAVDEGETQVGKPGFRRSLISLPLSKGDTLDVAHVAEIIRSQNSCTPDRQEENIIYAKPDQSR